LGIFGACLYEPQGSKIGDSFHFWGTSGHIGVTFLRGLKGQLQKRQRTQQRRFTLLEVNTTFGKVTESLRGTTTFPPKSGEIFQRQREEVFSPQTGPKRVKVSLMMTGEQCGGPKVISVYTVGGLEKRQNRGAESPAVLEASNSGSNRLISRGIHIHQG